ncbi:MAG: holin [Clostridia bacterium]|nr:holin [Clostridia bacterium]
MINWGEWWKAAGIRAIRTFAEAMLAYIGTGALVLGDVNWLAALSAGAMGAVTAVLLALAGLPEVEKTAEKKPPDPEE